MGDQFRSSGKEYVRPQVTTTDAVTMIEAWGPATASGASAGKPIEVDPIPVRPGKK